MVENINKLYEATTGSPHVIKALARIREITKGETLDNTAPSFQILCHRQKLNEAKEFVPDMDWDWFTMPEGHFEDCYKLLDQGGKNVG
jgi:hypothetical protein